ncbi:uncharacterized protein LOC120260596 isoform X1 [Dioscorea cayenensis subsp. rotundata]|uniref:Uncharacterized protein LOC120260596 isoform X1 n=1 Tax=Dioscorea cayennensis subsp. rotundata TaxID=55577 RepID=A0AB40B9T5_DIOCR|nr:uncharacterized protein LOC120260596 isoform X1 [Dioscorea cayenensis subsp. rotundata]
MHLISKVNTFFMDSRSSIRQGVLAKRRTHFQGNQFPITANAANRAAAYSTSNRMVNWNKPREAGTSFRRNDGEKSFAGKVVHCIPFVKHEEFDKALVDKCSQGVNENSINQDELWNEVAIGSHNRVIIYMVYV